MEVEHPHELLVFRRGYSERDGSKAMWDSKVDVLHGYGVVVSVAPRKNIHSVIT